MPRNKANIIERSHTRFGGAFLGRGRVGRLRGGGGRCRLSAEMRRRLRIAAELSEAAAPLHPVLPSGCVAIVSPSNGRSNPPAAISWKCGGEASLETKRRLRSTRQLASRRRPESAIHLGDVQTVSGPENLDQHGSLFRTKFLVG
jgi:hypothetical protein